MATLKGEPGDEPQSPKPSTTQVQELTAASIPTTLATLRVDLNRGLSQAEADARRARHGYNEVLETKRHPARQFLSKFWGISAWMLELIMLLSVALRKYSDLVVVGTLLVMNATLGFLQERRAAGVVDTLRRQLQISARVLRDGRWLLIPARELVPGDIVRLRVPIQLVDATQA